MADIKEVLKKEEVKKAVVYKGIHRILTSKAVPILPKDGVYNPTNQEEIDELEFQVTRGIVTKE